MSDPEHLARLKEGVEAWNEWRKSNPLIKPDLSEADLSKADLFKANLYKAFLSRADLSEANLSETNLCGANLLDADLIGANLSEANLLDADLIGANLSEANLSKADLRSANLSEANLVRANLSKADLYRANLLKADLSEANLSEANLSSANLIGANLSEAALCSANLVGANLVEANLVRANLSKADLITANLVDTNLEDADLTGCRVYGISVWNAKLDGAKQSNLIITPETEPAVQVDSLEVAQFIYLLLNNAKIRHVIDTITSKVVLILGRFTPERKVVLDTIREELRRRDYVPVLFDFEKPASKDLTGTVSTLANMARFIIADLTDPSCIPHELAILVPATVVPVQPILLEGQREYAMFPDLIRRYHWVLEPYQYNSLDSLLGHLNQRVIAPAEAKAAELKGKVAGTS
jgi:uncharacterized protein YjbI with pentapeptide repeats